MPKTQEDIALERLRNAILDGDLPAGEFLSQRKLAGRVGAAVVTVRGALRRLENEGLIENVPRWGVRIPVETEDTVRDRYYLREILEGAAAQRIAGTLSENQAEQLLELARQCDEAEGEGEAAIQEFAARHQALHRFVAEASGSPLLQQTLERLFVRGAMVTNARRGWSQGRSREPEHHQRLAQTLIAGPAAAAGEAMQEHVRQGLQAELSTLAAEGE